MISSSLIHLDAGRRENPRGGSKSIIHFEGELGQVFPWRRAFAQERARLVIGGMRLEGGMTVRPPPDGEVLKTAHVTGLVFIPGAKKNRRLGIYAVTSGRTPEREGCRADGTGRGDSETEVRLE